MEEEYEDLPEEYEEEYEEEYQEEYQEDVYEEIPEDLPEEQTEEAAPEDLPESESGETAPEEVTDQEPAGDQELTGEEIPETGTSISQEDLELILQEYSLSESENINDLKELIVSTGELYVQGNQQLVDACTALQQDMILGFVGLSILLGTLIGILFVKTFSVFIKGV